MVDVGAEDEVREVAGYGLVAAKDLREGAIGGWEVTRSGGKHFVRPLPQAKPATVLIGTSRGRMQCLRCTSRTHATPTAARSRRPGRAIGAGGVFMVPYFVWRGAAKAPAAAMASIMGLAITPVATAMYLSQHEGVLAAGVLGLVHAPIALALAVGAVFGAGLGARAARSANTALWTRLAAAALLLSSVRGAAKML